MNEVYYLQTNQSSRCTCIQRYNLWFVPYHLLYFTQFLMLQLHQEVISPPHALTSHKLDQGILLLHCFKEYKFNVVVLLKKTLHNFPTLLCTFPLQHCKFHAIFSRCCWASNHHPRLYSQRRLCKVVKISNSSSKIPPFWLFWWFWMATLAVFSKIPPFWWLFWLFSQKSNIWLFWRF